MKKFFIKIKEAISDGADILADFFEELLDMLLEIIEALSDD